MYHCPWAAEHAAMIVGAEMHHAPPSAWRDVQAARLGSGIAGDLGESWIALSSFARTMPRRPPAVLRALVGRLAAQRAALEVAWSRATRFLPRGELRLARVDACDPGAHLVVQQLQGAYLGRESDGAYVWRDGSPDLIEPLGAPLGSAYQDGVTITVSNKQSFRRHMVAVPAALASTLVEPQAANDARGKRRRDDEAPRAAAAEDSAETQAASTVRPTCIVVGPFAPWSARDVLAVFEPDDVLSLHDDVRFYPAPAGDLFAVAFTQSSEAHSRLVDELVARELSYEIIKDADLAARSAGPDAVPCDATLTIDSLDFAATSLRREYQSATFAERVAMQPKRMSSRFAPIELLFRSAGRPAPYTWEALAQLEPAPPPGARRAIGIERALAPPGDPLRDLHVPHKASPELARQMMDAFLWLAHHERTPEVPLARALLRQALLDGFYLRTMA